jgi:hypothetical protein
MARYRLTTNHFTEEDKLIEATPEKPVEVGDGTPFLWTRPPTLEMEPLDDAAKKAIEEERKRTAGRSMDPLDDLPMTLDPKQQIELVLQNLPADEQRQVLRGVAGNLPPIQRGAKI